MKTQEVKMENGEWMAQSALDCGRERRHPGCRLVRLVPNTGAQKSLRLFALLFCFVILHFSFCLRAQGQYAIDWHKISGGGGTSSGGNYSVSGTIGQPDASHQQMTGGNYSLTGGFWSLISVEQTAGAPMLYISHSGNTVTIYWQNISGWNLQENGNLSSPSGWSPNNGATLVNGTNYLNLVSPTGNLFFRLAQ